ncbi:MAG: M24 family metallopeptidase [Rhodobacterales bacterium]|nr:M24 family metallopeptidase [Rhodobacterales bacterium]
MIPISEFAARRQQLMSTVEGPILLVGNGERSRNLPMNKLRYRQDSTFLYFTGCNVPGAAALLDDGKTTLFLPPHDPAYNLWHGPTPSLEEQQATLGMDAVDVLPSLEGVVRGRNPKLLAVADENQNRRLTGWTQKALQFGREHGDLDLVDAVIGMRRVKSDVEIDEMRMAARHSKVAHEAVMAATRPGGHERTLTALFEGVLAARGLALGYGTILTQRGEVLHNHDHNSVLEAGKLLLLDGGGEVTSAYGVDITRTWPVSGTFSPRQRAAYDAVLAAEKASIALCTAGTEYREVHFMSCRIIAQFLIDEGIITCGLNEAVERGAHALFFPHGIGHHLGMDVHDLENFGDRPSYPLGMGRPQQFGTRYLRLNLPLQANWVVTVEPGFYVVPAILNNPKLRTEFASIVNFEKANDWLGFGGIRIEDDIRITNGDPEVLTDSTKETHAVEALVGSGPTAEELLLCGSQP